MVKHEAGWQVTGSPEETLVWTSPTGHAYRSERGGYDVPATRDLGPDPPPF